MSAEIYIEGSKKGENSKEMTIRCRKAFHDLLDPLCPPKGKPGLIPCGGRDRTFKDFKIALKQDRSKFIGLLVDSEDPVEDLEKPWEHLKKRDNWDRPKNAEEDQVLLMTTSMETWIASDRDTLRKHYGQRLRDGALPPLQNLEKRHRHDVLEGLERASQDCTNSYSKGNRSFELLAKLDPAVLMRHLPSFVRIERILKKRL